jgi:cyclomaltodextrinase / maltogenic alpha-amylase / neopullulanase
METVSDWTRHAVWWHVYPLGFTGAPERADGGPVHHRLTQLIGWLDYAVQMGCSGLLLGPVFASGTHGYDTVDHLRIDPRLGDGDDFDELIAQARRRGLRVLLDGVFNHVGREFPQLLEAERAGSSSSAADWFVRRPGPHGTLDHDTFEGHHALVRLNHDEPAVADHVERVLRHWLERGVAGWRFDAAYAVPASFWARVLPQVRRDHPDAWFLGEMIHGDYAGYVEESGLDSVTQYELWKAIWSSLNDRNMFELKWALERHDRFLERFVPQTFVGNHDVTRLATRLDDPRHVGHALAVLFTVAGVPSVYYGDEQAFRGVKEERAGGDDAIRPAFPDRPQDLPPQGWSVYRTHQRLIGLRRRSPWLVDARTVVEHVTSTSMALRSRSDEPDGDVVVLLNVADDPYRFSVDLPLGPGRLSITTGDECAPADGDPLLVPGHSWSVLTGRGADLPVG